MERSKPYIIHDGSYRAEQAFALAEHLQGFDVQISCGLDVVAQAAATPANFKVHIGDPSKNYDAFNLILVPSHDPHPNLPNIIETTGLLNRISPEYLNGKEKDFGLPKPYIAVLVGGHHIGGNFTADDAIRLADTLNKTDASILITTSKRTEQAATKALKAALKRPNVFYDYNVDGLAANPYEAMLASADFILVTADSVRMISEAASSGKEMAVFKPQQVHFSYIKLAENISQAQLPLAEAKRCAELIKSLLQK